LEAVGGGRARMAMPVGRWYRGCRVGAVGTKRIRPKMSVRRGRARSGLGSARCTLVGRRRARGRRAFRGKSSCGGQRRSIRSWTMVLGRAKSVVPRGRGAHWRRGDCRCYRERVPSQRRGSAVVVVLASVDPTELPASWRETAEVVPRRASGVGGAAPGRGEHEGRGGTEKLGAVAVLERVFAAQRRRSLGGEVWRSWFAGRAARARPGEPPRSSRSRSSWSRGGARGRGRRGLHNSDIAADVALGRCAPSGPRS
jgi:hypothetical protein